MPAVREVVADMKRLQILTKALQVAQAAQAKNFASPAVNLSMAFGAPVSGAINAAAERAIRASTTGPELKTKVVARLQSQISAIRARYPGVDIT